MHSRHSHGCSDLIFCISFSIADQTCYTSMLVDHPRHTISYVNHYRRGNVPLQRNSWWLIPQAIVISWHKDIYSLSPESSQDRTSVLTDFVKPEFEYLWVTPSQSDLSQLVAVEQRAESLLSAVIDWLSAEENFSVSHLGDELRTLAQRHQRKANKFFLFLRMALTGLKVCWMLFQNIICSGICSVWCSLIWFP